MYGESPAAPHRTARAGRPEDGWSWSHVTRERVVAYVKMYVPAALSIASDFWRVSVIGPSSIPFAFFRTRMTTCVIPRPIELRPLSYQDDHMLLLTLAGMIRLFSAPDNKTFPANSSSALVSTRILGVNTTRARG